MQWREFFWWGETEGHLYYSNYTSTYPMNLELCGQKDAMLLSEYKELQHNSKRLLNMKGKKLALLYSTLRVYSYMQVNSF